MDSVVSGYASSSQPRSGGKTVRLRRTAVVRTPYDRPAPRSREPPQQNPNWISRLVYKPARVIASGAGKFISSVVFSESSSSSSEEEDSSSDIEGGEDVEKNITDEDLVNGQESTLQRLSSKRVIEQLLMQETFAREEGDRLIDIIKARVLDHPSVPNSYEGMHNGLTSEVNVGEMSNKAVMEAKRWLEEKKSASNSKSKGNEDGAGSPVDVAKSYMRARMPWGSPSVDNSEFWSPPPVGMQLLKEGTPFPYSAGNLSSSKLKRRSGSNPSWNIQDEIRKVRAKATEEMLKTVSPRSLEPKQTPYVLPASEQNQTMEANQAVEDTNGTGVDNSNDPNNTNAVLALGATLDPSGSFCIPKDVFEISKEADEIGATRPTSNSFPSSSPSSQVPMEGQPKPKPKPPEETEASQPIAETPGDDITIENENNNSDSSAASTHEEEWLPGDQSLPNSNSASSSPGTSKVLAYTRKGRGRGRGRGKGRGK